MFCKLFWVKGLFFFVCVVVFDFFEVVSWECNWDFFFGEDSLELLGVLLLFFWLFVVILVWVVEFVWFVVDVIEGLCEFVLVWVDWVFLFFFNVLFC